jgi:hypothetical protein
MKGFEPVTFTWKGESYTVPAEGQLMLIARIEDALSFGTGEAAIVVLTRNGGPSHARLAAAFGAALRHAGADVSDDEVYLSLMEDFASGKADVASKVQGAVLALLSIVAPPIAAHIRGDTKKKPQPRERTSSARSTT